MGAFYSLCGLVGLRMILDYLGTREGLHVVTWKRPTPKQTAAYSEAKRS
jgi:hypothetical protein